MNLEIHGAKDGNENVTQIILHPLLLCSAPKWLLIKWDPKALNPGDLLPGDKFQASPLKPDSQYSVITAD